MAIEITVANLTAWVNCATANFNKLINRTAARSNRGSSVSRVFFCPRGGRLSKR